MEFEGDVQHLLNKAWFFFKKGEQGKAVKCLAQALLLDDTIVIFKERRQKIIGPNEQG